MTPFNFVSCLSAKKNKDQAEEACHTLSQAVWTRSFSVWEMGWFSGLQNNPA